MNNTADKRNVLIVDDHALTRFGLKTALETRQNLYDIIEAESGEKGIELSKQHNPDLVIMDLSLPGIDGIEATRHIKGMNENTKVVILTSNDEQEHVLDALTAGAQAYCLKDIEPEKILNVIDSISDGAMWFDPGVSQNIVSMLTHGRKYTPEETAKERVQLTDREQDVLKLIVDGYNNAEISEKLSISIHTAKAHVCNILHKLGVEDRTQAAIKALKDRII